MDLGRPLARHDIRRPHEGGVDEAGHDPATTAAGTDEGAPARAPAAPARPARPSTAAR